MRSKITGALPVPVLLGLLTPTGLTGWTGLGLRLGGPTVLGGLGPRTVQWIPLQGGGGVCCLGVEAPSEQSERRLSHLSVQACLLPVAPQFPRQPRHAALQAISFKLAKLSAGNNTPKEQQIATNANLFVLTRNFVIALPPCRCQPWCRSRRVAPSVERWRREHPHDTRSVPSCRHQLFAHSFGRRITGTES